MYPKFIIKYPLYEDVWEQILFENLEITTTSPFKQVALILEIHGIHHKDKTILEIIEEVNHEKNGIYNQSYTNETIIALDNLLLNLKTLAEWLYMGKQIPENLRAEFELFDSEKKLNLVK